MIVVANLQDIHFIVSLRMEGSSHTTAELEYEVMRSPMISQGVAVLWGFLDLKQAWESLDKTYKKACSLVGYPALGKMARNWQRPKTGMRTNLVT